MQSPNHKVISSIPNGVETTAGHNKCHNSRVNMSEHDCTWTRTTVNRWKNQNLQHFRAKLDTLNTVEYLGFDYSGWFTDTHIHAKPNNRK
ncbi:hypothetical protein Y032_0116g575 [Ancylostoma ceylanicum]|uniref:Uncharacterized protein n=1 Tax=Ancylostoma ceylanicum TaxID=53326 RepID=A0A016TBI9_9BILA|nr:hypothetical protein Y032_0116g575 [Ancylostoma ceylanicum]